MERIMTVTGADGEESLERTLNELTASGATLRSVAWKEGAGLWFVWSTSGALPPATTERITTVTGADGGESLEAALNELKASGATLREVVWKEAGYWVVWSTSGAPFPTTTTVPPATTTPPPTTTTAPPIMTTTAPPTTTVPSTTTAPPLATTTVPPTTVPPTTVPPTTSPPTTTTTAPPPPTTTTVPPPGFGAEAEFLSADGASYNSVAVFDAGKFVVAYADGSDGGHGTAKVGTVSGTAIAFGAEAEFLSAAASFVSAAALSGTQFVVAYKDGSDGHGRARVGTVSDTSIIFGAAAEFLASSVVFVSAAALSGTQFVVAYADAIFNNHGRAEVGTVSGDAITFGAEAEFLLSLGVAGASYISAAALDAGKFVVAYRDGTDANHGKAKVGVVSGTAIAFGAEAEFLSANGATYISAAAMSGTQFVVAYKDDFDDGHGTARVGTVSGDAIAFGAEAEFLPANGANYVSAAALGGAQFAVAYGDGFDSNHGTAKVGTVSGDAIAFGAEAEFLSADGAAYVSAAALGAGEFVVAYTNGADANHGEAKVFGP